MSEIGYFFGVMESPIQPEPVQEVVGSQWLKYDSQERRVPFSRIHTCPVG